MCQACPVPQACRRTPTKGTKQAGTAATGARWEAHEGLAATGSLSPECRSRLGSPQVCRGPTSTTSAAPQGAVGTIAPGHLA
ncbi:hypothetical protein E2C01_072068 [Portunus trituberculatus]|uniref:Uncharacterized protein n=1 Tax=Portunus trituberculatus TaxID=210409 RepID=A0A5B7HYX5_PORTR|nr:hypothetical protein [Portunus trituberculatus]